MVFKFKFRVRFYFITEPFAVVCTQCRRWNIGCFSCTRMRKLIVSQSERTCKTANGTLAFSQFGAFPSGFSSIAIGCTSVDQCSIQWFVNKHNFTFNLFWVNAFQFLNTTHHDHFPFQCAGNRSAQSGNWNLYLLAVSYVHLSILHISS